MKNACYIIFSRSRGLLSSAALALLALISHSTSSVQAATYYWDTTGATSGTGSTPTGTWANSSPNWSTSSAGTNAASSITTNLKDDVFFSAGVDATGTYTVTVSGTQATRSITVEEGNVTLSGGTLTFLTGTGGITVSSGANATVSSNVTTSGAIILNSAAAGSTLALNTGTFTRNTGATLNVQGAGAVTSTQTNLSANNANTGIIGPWVTFGTGTNTRYATFSGSTITSFTGTAAATAANLTDTTGFVNYDLAAATGTVQPTVSANTIRYTGAAATTTLGATSFTVNGILNSGTGTWTIASNKLTIGSDRELVVNTANASVTISSDIQDNGAGASGLTKTGTNTLTLSGNNTYTGVTYITQGTLNVTSANALGSTIGETIIHSTAAASTGGVLSLSGGVSIAENITIEGPGDGTTNGTSLQYGPAITTGTGGGTITGTITLTGSIGYRFGAAGGTTLTLGLIQRTGSNSASIIFSASSGGTINVTQAIDNNLGGLTAHGGGTVILSASNNDIAQAVVQNSSTIRVAANDALNTTRYLQIGNSSGNSSTTATNDVGTFYLEGVNQTINELVGFANSGNAAATSSRKITSSSANNSILTVGNGNGSSSFDGVIENGSGGGTIAFTKTGTGTQTLAGTVANTNTGATTVIGGTLVLAKSANVNAVAGNVVIGDGTGNDILRLTNSEQIADTSTITFNGTGSNAGIFRLFNQSETVGGLISTGGAGIIENESGAVGASTLTVSVAASTTHAFSGVLRDGDGSGTDGTLAVTKVGTGTQIFSGASTYTGGTIINLGTLLANNTTGSATGVGPVTVASGATLGGTGIIGLNAASRLTVNGTLSPGATAGAIESLEISIASASGAATSGITLNSATLAFDLGTSGSSISSVGTSDMLLLTGVLNESSDFSFTGANVFNFGGTGMFGWYKLVDSNASSDLLWSGLTLGVDREITGGLSYTNLASGLSGAFYLGDGASAGDFGDIYFHVTPEPGRALLMLAGLLTLGMRRRRR